MDVLLFVFSRKEGTSREDFRRHYLGVHAPMSVKHQIATRRYVVRITEGGTGPLPVDAVTEIWTPSVDEFFDPKTGFDSPEAANEIIADAFNFLAPFPIYQVKRHVRHEQDGPATPLAARSPGTTAVRLAHSGATAGEAGELAPAGPGVRTSIHYEVVRNFSADGPDLAAVDLVHLLDDTAAAALAPDAYLLGEYVHQHDARDIP